MAKCELQVWDVLSLSTSVGLKGFLTCNALWPEGSEQMGRGWGKGAQPGYPLYQPCDGTFSHAGIASRSAEGCVHSGGSSAPKEVV